jgi:hypothetical protein
LLVSFLLTVGLLADVMLSGGATPWRFLLGAAVVILVPGYLLVALLFPLSEDIDGFERVALACALSLVITVSVTLGLAELHIRLSARTDVLALGGVVFVLLPAVVWKRATVSRSRQYIPRLPWGTAPALTYCFVGLVGLITWGVVGTNLGAVGPQFYISNSHGVLGAYATSVRPGSMQSVRLNVENPTGQRISYRVRERDGGGGERWGAVNVGARKSWVRRIYLPASGSNRSVRLRFTFFRHNHVAGDLWITYRIVS